MSDWILVGFHFPTDTPVVPASPALNASVSMPLGSMVEFQWRVKTLRITVSATVRWYGNQGDSTSPNLKDTTNVIEWVWDETVSTPPEDRLPLTPETVGTWNRLFTLATVGSYTTEITPFSVYEQGEANTPTDDPQIVSYTLTPTLRIGIGSSTGQPELYADANGADYEIEIWGTLGISADIEGIDDDVRYSNTGAGTTIGDTSSTGSMGAIELNEFSSGPCLQDYADGTNHAGLSVHVLDVVAEVIEQHPVPGPLS